MLTVEDIHVAYGNVQAVRGLSLTLQEGAVVGLVGANGAGKTSTLNAITALVPHRGRIAFRGEDISKAGTAEIVKRGLVQIAQGRQLFPDMTVRENMEMGAFLKPAAMRERADGLVERFPVLAERINQRAGTLSGGEQQMLAVARALMSAPLCLLIDEPCLGLSPKMVERLGMVIADLNADGLTVLLVEQNTSFVFELASYAYVLENGTVALEGTPAELEQNDKVRSAYLGI